MARWTSIEAALRERYGPCDLRVLKGGARLGPTVAEAVRRGERFFVAAGGDGTVQGVVQALLTTSASASGDLCLGAVGLGSSNDFHKPRQPAQSTGGVPCKLDRRQARRRDVGVLTYETPSGEEGKRYWLLNCSAGVTAEANAFFNAPDALLSWLKARSTSAAIAYAAFHSILTYRPRPVRVGSRGSTGPPVRLTNLAVLKSPYCSGAFRYEVPFEPRSGTLHLHLSEDMSRTRMLLMLLHLARGRSKGQQQTRSWTADQLALEADTPFAVEFDGEVLQARRAHFSVHPRALEVCP